MDERWRKPARIVAAEDDQQRIYHDGNVFRRQADITVDGETLARMRLGYLCMRCYEPHEQAFPQVCSLCGYSIAEFQTRDLAQEFEGVKHIGPATTLDDEMERWREERARRDFRKEASIWVPPDAA